MLINTNRQRCVGCIEKIKIRKESLVEIEVRIESLTDREMDIDRLADRVDRDIVTCKMTGCEVNTQTQIAKLTGEVKM